MSAGGGYIVHNGEQQVIRGTGLIANLEDVANIVVGNRNGVPIYVRNLGKVAFAPMLRQGAVTRRRQGRDRCRRGDDVDRAELARPWSIGSRRKSPKSSRPCRRRRRS